MKLQTVVQILQMGFAGLAYLMAVLTFRLMRSEQRRPGGIRATFLAACRSYMRYTVALGTLVIVAQGVDTYVRVRANGLSRDEARICRDGLERLIHAGTRQGGTYQSLQLEITHSVAGCQRTLNSLTNDME